MFRPTPILLAGWLLGLGPFAACESSRPAAGTLADVHVDGSAGQSEAPATSAPPTAAPPAPATTAATSVPLQILRFAFTSGVRDKEPVDKLEVAKPGQRVYAHLAVRNRSNETRHVRLFFEVNGHARTKLELSVEPSWSYRTWGYNTVLESDTDGELTLVVTDDHGSELTTARLPIRS